MTSHNIQVHILSVSLFLTGHMLYLVNNYYEKRNMLYYILIFIVFINPVVSIAGQTEEAKLPDTSATKVSSTKLGIIGGVTAAGVVIGQIHQSGTYWNERTAFHAMPLDKEYPDALMADKFGHLFFANFLASTYKSAFEWVGYNQSNAALLGGGVALAYQTLVEMQDGFSGGKPYLGFSYGDMLFNTAGAIFPYLQINYSVLNRFRFKASFQKSSNFDRLNYNSITEDYESTYHWLSINICDLLPDNIQQWYPEFVNLAIGHSVSNIDRYGAGGHELYLALDWNLEALPGDNFFCDFIKQTFNFYKLPAPAVKIYPNVVWYGLKF